MVVAALEEEGRKSLAVADCHHCRLEAVEVLEVVEAVEAVEVVEAVEAVVGLLLRIRMIA